MSSLETEWDNYGTLLPRFEDADVPSASPLKRKETEEKLPSQIQENNNNKRAKREQYASKERKKVEKTTEAPFVVRVQTVAMSLGALKRVFSKQDFVKFRNYLRKTCDTLSKVTYWGSILANCLALERDVNPSQEFYRVVLQTVMGKKTDYTASMEAYGIPVCEAPGLTIFQNVLAHRMQANAKLHVGAESMKQRIMGTLRWNGITSGEARKMASHLIKEEEYEYEINVKKNLKEEQEKKKRYEEEFKRYKKERDKVSATAKLECVNSFLRFLLRQRHALEGRLFSLLPICRMGRSFIPFEKNELPHLLSKTKLGFEKFMSKLASKVKIVKKKLVNKKWRLLSEMQSDGHRLMVKFGVEQIMPASEAQLNRSKKRLLYPPQEKKKKKILPETTESLEKIEKEFELIGIDPGRDQVMAWVRNNSPKFYSKKQYRDDFCIAGYAKHSAYERLKQRRRWESNSLPNYFEIHSTLSLKQWDPGVMKENIKRLVEISEDLFQFYQRGCFNRLKFLLYKKRRQGLEKITAMLTNAPKKKEKKQSKYEQQQDQLQKKERREKLKKKWMPIEKQLKIERKKAEEKRNEERKKREQAKQKNNNNNNTQQTSFKKNQNKKTENKKKHDRVATFSRRQKEKARKEKKNLYYKEKSFESRKPSMNVDSDFFPCPNELTVREFLVAEQLVELQKKHGDLEWLKLREMQTNFEEAQKKKKSSKILQNMEQNIRVALKQFYQKLKATFQKQTNDSTGNGLNIEKQKGLLKQWVKKEDVNQQTEAAEMLNSKTRTEKKLVIGFGAAKFPSHGIPRESIKNFLRSKKVTVYDINEYYTSKKCCVCGKVKEKKKKIANSN